MWMWIHVSRTKQTLWSIAMDEFTLLDFSFNDIKCIGTSAAKKIHAELSYVWNTHIKLKIKSPDLDVMHELSDKKRWNSFRRRWYVAVHCSMSFLSFCTADQCTRIRVFFSSLHSFSLLIQFCKAAESWSSNWEVIETLIQKIPFALNKF